GSRAVARPTGEERAAPVLGLRLQGDERRRYRRRDENRTRRAAIDRLVVREDAARARPGEVDGQDEGAASDERDGGGFPGIRGNLHRRVPRSGELGGERDRQYAAREGAERGGASRGDP